ncbi:MAG TPA: phenylacetic acid degradation bifunctional protein PaaZ, partial [Saprospiraceae bacterium]|nr:phenylacetic acid degradation bifunctional protein PaaZ [Saprospiraceae bacterium]
MQLIENYIAGKWNPGEGKETTMLHSIHGQPIAYSHSGGVDFAAILDYGRKTGGPVLRKMTFHERGRMIKALALYLLERKDKYYPISYQTGATKADSW